MRYAVVIEKAEKNYSAYVPDLPGCIATGNTLEQAEAEIREAIEFHIEGMREDDLPRPEPVSKVEYLEVEHSAKHAGMSERPPGIDSSTVTSGWPDKLDSEPYR